MTNTNTSIDLDILDSAENLLRKRSKTPKNTQSETENLKIEAELVEKNPKKKKVGRKRKAEKDKKVTSSFTVIPETLKKIDEISDYLKEKEFGGALSLSKGSVVDVLIDRFYKEHIASKEDK